MFPCGRETAALVARRQASRRAVPERPLVVLRRVASRRGRQARAPGQPGLVAREVDRDRQRVRFAWLWSCTSRSRRAFRSAVLDAQGADGWVVSPAYGTAHEGGKPRLVALGVSDEALKKTVRRFVEKRHAERTLAMARSRRYWGSGSPRSGPASLPCDQATYRDAQVEEGLVVCQAVVGLLAGKRRTRPRRGSRERDVHRTVSCPLLGVSTPTCS